LERSCSNSRRHFGPGITRSLNSTRFAICSRRIPLAVELRNRDWVTGAQLDATLDYFRSRRVHVRAGRCAGKRTLHRDAWPERGDQSRARLLSRATDATPKGFIRGRTVAERFDYDYSDREVVEITDRLREVESEVKELRIVANNNPLELRSSPR
jgi:uncharacterized protein YecE (DUF72 family)